MNRILEGVDRFQRRHPVIGLPLAVFKRFGDQGGGRLVTTIAYWSFFSIFPLLLVFVAVLNIVLRDDPEQRQRLLDGALGQVPVIGTELGESQSALGGSWVTVALGAATALWSGLAAANALQVALEEVWDVPGFERPNAVVQRGRSVGFLVVLAVGLSASTVAVSATSIFGSNAATFVAAHLVSFAVNVAVLYATFTLLVSERHPWRQSRPGILVAAAVLVVLQSVGRWVIERYIAGASDTYGTFAIVIALLSWFYLVARVVLLGAELNAVLVHRLWPRSVVDSTGATEGDRRAMLHDQRRIQRDRHVGVAVSTDGQPAMATIADDGPTAAGS